MIPVSISGRLAVSRDHAGRGLGADMLADALRRIALASRFYLACAEFIERPADSRMLFLPIETMVAAFD
ncbi:hypothetical protein [Dongia sp. agr-C8]